MTPSPSTSSSRAEADRAPSRHRTGRVALEQQAVHIHDCRSTIPSYDRLRARRGSATARPSSASRSCARVSADRRHRPDARAWCSPFTGQADRARHDLRRPGRDRDRERAAVRGGAGADRGAAGIARIPDRDRATCSTSSAARRPSSAGARCHRRTRLSCARRVRVHRVQLSTATCPLGRGQQRSSSAHVHVYRAQAGAHQPRLRCSGRVALEQRTIHVPDVLADPEFQRPDWQAVGKQRTVLGVPLLREGSPARRDHPCPQRGEAVHREADRVSSRPSPTRP